MIVSVKSARVSLTLGVCSMAALILSNFALMDIQRGEGHGLEWAIMHVSYAVFILFHISAIVTFVRMMRKIEKQKTEEKSN